VEHCLKGFNSSMFAYGQTSSGKTHTMTGTLGNEEQVRHLPIKPLTKSTKKSTAMHSSRAVYSTVHDMAGTGAILSVLICPVCRSDSSPECSNTSSSRLLQQKTSQ
jgi:hypothetical protein